MTPSSRLLPRLAGRSKQGLLRPQLTLFARFNPGAESGYYGILRSRHHRVGVRPAALDQSGNRQETAVTPSDGSALAISTIIAERRC